MQGVSLHNIRLYFIINNILLGYILFDSFGWPLKCHTGKGGGGCWRVKHLQKEKSER